MPERKLAAATEFTPGIVGDLQRALRLIARSRPDRDRVIESLRSEFFPHSALQYGDPEKAHAQQVKRANNVLIGMRQYGLIPESVLDLTPLGERLLSMAPDAAREEFAQHILLNLDGLDLLRAVQDLQRRDGRVTKESLAAQLRDGYGFTLPRDTVKHLSMLNWLRTADVLPAAGYNVDQARVTVLSGIALGDLDDWQAMPLPRQAFLRSLKRLIALEGTPRHAVRRVLDQAELEFGRLYVDAQTTRSVIAPLEADGWIVSSGRSGGRGSKSGDVEATARLIDLDVERALAFPLPPLPAELKAKMTLPLSDIAQGLSDTDTHVAGVSLELLALRMIVALGLVPVELRKRDDKTGGGEVDVLAEGAHLHFSRWLVQCKNQRAAVSLSALAKEIGMAVLLRAHVIVLATTGRFTASVAEHAGQVGETTAMQVVLVDGTVIRDYLANGDAALQRYFHDTAIATLQLKRPQAFAVPEPS